MAFEVEVIPSDARLFLRVHEQQYVVATDEPNGKKDFHRYVSDTRTCLSTGKSIQVPKKRLIPFLP